MEILILGYSNLVKKKIIPLFKKELSNIKFSICSKSQTKKKIGSLNWYRDYRQALKNSNADIVIFHFQILYIIFGQKNFYLKIFM